LSHSIFGLIVIFQLPSTLADGKKIIPDENGFSQIVVEVWLKPISIFILIRPINGTAID